MKTKCVSVLVVSLFPTACAKHPPRLTPDRRAFTEVSTDLSCELDSEERMDITMSALDPLHAADLREQVNARFRGVDRRAPKTSIVDTTLEKFNNLSQLVASLPTVSGNSRFEEIVHVLAAPQRLASEPQG
jgi:hypothetical protein